MGSAMPWTKRFPRLIALPDGRALLTLQDAKDMIEALPQAERNKPDWHIALEALMIAAERDSQVGLAAAAVLRALGAPTPTELPSLKPQTLRVIR